MEGIKDLREAFEPQTTIGKESVAAQQEALQIHLNEAIIAGDEAHIKYYTARLNELQGITPVLEDDVKIGSSVNKMRAERYQEEAAEWAVKYGKDRHYKELLKKAELELIKDKTE